MHIPRISLVALRLSLTTGQVEGNIDIMMSLRQNKDLSLFHGVMIPCYILQSTESSQMVASNIYRLCRIAWLVTDQL